MNFSFNFAVVNLILRLQEQIVSRKMCIVNTSLRR